MIYRQIELGKKELEQYSSFFSPYGYYKFPLYEDALSKAEKLLEEKEIKGYPTLNEVEYLYNKKTINFYFGLGYGGVFNRDHREEEEKLNDFHARHIKISYIISEDFDITTIKNKLKWEECDDPYYGYFLSDTTRQYQVVLYLEQSKNYRKDNDDDDDDTNSLMKFVRTVDL